MYVCVIINHKTEETVSFWLRLGSGSVIENIVYQNQFKAPKSLLDLQLNVMNCTVCGFYKTVYNASKKNATFKRRQ